MEVFRPVVGFEEFYSVSDTGKVYSNRWKRIMTPKRSKVGYLRITLCDGKRRRNTSVHRIVAEAFIPNPEKKPTVNHINENKADNRVENLEWATNAEQNVHGTRIQRAQAHTDYAARTRKMDYEVIASKHNYGAENMCGRKRTAAYREEILCGVFISQADAARFTGAPVIGVSECVNGKRKTSGGYVFREIGECEEVVD